MSQEQNKSVFSEIFLDKEARLSKKSWHYKLMKFTFGEKMIPMYNFCPYFWMCILAIIISPFVIPIKGFFVFCGYILGGIGFFLDEIVIEPTNKKLKENKSRSLENCKENIFYGYLYYHMELYKDAEMDEKYLLTEGEKSYNTSVDYYEYQKIYLNWREITPDWREKIEKWKKEREESFEERRLYYNNLAEKMKVITKEREAKAELDRKEKIKRDARIKNNLVKFGKYLSFLLIFPVAFVAYWVYKLAIISYTWLIGLFAKFTMAGFIIFLKAFVFVVVLIAVIVLIVLFVRWIFSKFNSCAMRSFKQKMSSIGVVLVPFNHLGKAMGSLVMGMYNGIKIFIIFFKGWKSDNCPEIIWEEEDNIDLNKK